jgi:hypothetical protein
VDGSFDVPMSQSTEVERNMEIAMLAMTLAVYGGVLIGVFLTKTAGFGRFTTSIVLLVLVLFTSTIGFVLGKLELSAARQSSIRSRWLFRWVAHGKGRDPAGLMLPRLHILAH